MYRSSQSERSMGGGEAYNVQVTAKRGLTTLASTFVATEPMLVLVDRARVRMTASERVKDTVLSIMGHPSVLPNNAREEKQFAKMPRIASCVASSLQTVSSQSLDGFHRCLLLGATVRYSSSNLLMDEQETRVSDISLSFFTTAYMYHLLILTTLTERMTR